ncbi:hypothetical protein D3C83_192660 [compost metagenome]
MRSGSGMVESVDISLCRWKSAATQPAVSSRRVRVSSCVVVWSAVMVTSASASDHSMPRETATW